MSGAKNPPSGRWLRKREALIIGTEIGDSWNEASEAELAGPPALGARQATPTAHVPYVSHPHTHRAASPHRRKGRKGTKLKVWSQVFPVLYVMLSRHQ